MIYPQLLLDTHDELIVDLFAGGGGASCGIEMATGRQVDVAVNHDAEAVAMHEENHPQTDHHVCDVYEADPHAVTEGRDVGLLWASPDCTFHSKARGSKPMREVRRRALSWVVHRWAGQVCPRVIMLENVEELQKWGPLVAKRDRTTGRVLKRSGGVAAPGEHVPIDDQKLIPDKSRAGETFDAWVKSLERLDYEVEWKELRACDYGAPTIRKRLFVVARRDGRPIQWPEPTHGEPGSKAVRAEGRRPYRTAAECIDWSIPTPSIFLTSEEAKSWAKEQGKYPPKRPLAENTMKRIARGLVKYVLESDEPYVVELPTGEDAASFISTYYGAKTESDVRGNGMNAPIGTQTTENRHALVTGHLAPLTHHGRRPGLDLEKPAPTITAAHRGEQALVMAYLAQQNSGFNGTDGHSMLSPVSTVCASGPHQSLVAATLAKLRGTSTDADVEEPLHTVSAGGNHHALLTAHLMHNTTGHSGARPDEPMHTVTTGGHATLVTSFLMKYYGQSVGQHLRDPLHSVTTKDRYGLVVVSVDGEEFVILDIGLRMLQPSELYRAQGFPKSYVTSRAGGEALTKTAQVRMCGNSVPPQLVEALVSANLPELAARPEVAFAA